jgi:L-aminopeptidase/D-esterase-like protein
LLTYNFTPLTNCIIYDLQIELQKNENINANFFNNCAENKCMTIPGSKVVRARNLDLPFSGEVGKYNAITDVPGVHVGFTTLTDPKKNIRTGVTAVIPYGDTDTAKPVWGGQYSLNGNGEMTGTHWINDAGYFIGPICITNTHAVGMVHHGVTSWMLNKYKDYFQNSYHAWAMPVVAETYDGVLNDINKQIVTSEHAVAALNSANSGYVKEGSSGGGNGMICYDFKGGTGTSSRLVQVGSENYTVGALVQANHGIRPWLNILGKPIGKLMPENTILEKETGSIIAIIGTNAPLSALSLRQIAKRAAIGVGRGGSAGGNSSGDIFLAFSVGDEQPIKQTSKIILNRKEMNPEHIDPLYLSAIECVEEAVVNALVAGEDVETFKPKGQICRALNLDELKKYF